MVTITGTHLKTATAVDFGATPAKSFTATSATTIKAVTPVHTPGTVVITVTTPGGKATAPTDYRFVAPRPTITGITPQSGPATGTTKVTISGTHFRATAKVFFGSTTAQSVVVTSPTTIKAVTRTHTAGAVKVTVTTAGGPATLATGFTFVDQAPTITGFAPGSGPITGTTTVTITGSHLAKAKSVRFGGTTARASA